MTDRHTHLEHDLDRAAAFVEHHHPDMAPVMLIAATQFGTGHRHIGAMLVDAGGRARHGGPLVQCARSYLAAHGYAFAWLESVSIYTVTNGSASLLSSHERLDAIMGVRA